jgi:eukaryotic-like serine/threonine-protein kinase
MELLNGTELAVRMTEGPIPIQEAVSIAAQVAEGLAFAHDNGVIHRDIKPSNITLLARGRVKIMDFGIARLKVSDIKTQLGTRLGTPKYMSPEQSTGDTLDHRTDIFSLGIVLYEMLTGVKLFKGDTLAQVLHNVANMDPLPPSRIKPEIPPLLDLVIKRAMEKKPSARYASAWEMVEDLQQCLHELPATAYTLPGITSSKINQETSISAADEKTLVLKPATDNTVVLRRLSSEVDTNNRFTLSRRFDSEKALTRLQAPTARDRQRLTRVPQPPRLLRRLLHDRDLALFSFALVIAGIISAVLVLS